MLRPNNSMHLAVLCVTLLAPKGARHAARDALLAPPIEQEGWGNDEED